MLTKRHMYDKFEVGYNALVDNTGESVLKKRTTKNIALLFVLFLSFCFLFSCNDNEDKADNNVDTNVSDSVIKTYKINVEKGLELGEIKADAKSSEENGKNGGRVMSN